jgi:hypothetical protein
MSRRTYGRSIRAIYSSACSPYSTGPSQTPLGGNTGSRGASGTSSAPISDSPSGCRLTDRTSNRYGWLSSPFIAGPVGYAADDRQPTPFGPSSAILNGIIVSTPAVTPNSRPVTGSCWPACSERLHLPPPGHRSRQGCCNGFSTISTPTKPNTASLVGLRCWASFFS